MTSAVAHALILTLEAEARVQGQPGLLQKAPGQPEIYRETLSFKVKK